MERNRDAKLASLKLPSLCLLAVQPEGFGPRLLVSEDMVTVGAEVVAECWSDRWVVL